MCKILKIFLLLIFGFAIQAFCETVGPITFDLPSQWYAGNKFDDPHGTTIIYLQKGKEEETETFGVNVSDTPTHNHDNIKSIKKGLEEMLPGEKVEIKEVEKNSSGVIYEWHTKDLCGIGRAFSWDKGSAILSYQSTRCDQAKIKIAWLPVLKSAKVQ